MFANNRSVSIRRSPSAFTRQNHQWDNRNEKYIVIYFFCYLSIFSLQEWKPPYQVLFIYNCKTRNFLFCFYKLANKLGKIKAYLFSGLFSSDILKRNETVFWSNFSISSSLSKTLQKWFGLENLWLSNLYKTAINSII